MGLDAGIYKSETNEEVIYWRKENHFHKWFVDNVQNGVDECDDALLTKKVLKQFLKTCKQQLFNLALSERKYDEYGNFIFINLKEGDIVLPTQEGFFFGSTDYSNSYLESIVLAIPIIEKLIKEHDFKNEPLIYWSSW